MSKACFTYIVECSDGSLYTGWTNDLNSRIEAHNRGKGAKYTKARLPVSLVFKKEFDTKSEAMQFEYFVKQLKRNEKEKLISSYQTKS